MEPAKEANGTVWDEPDTRAGTRRPGPVIVTYDVRARAWELVEPYPLDRPGFSLRIPAGFQFDLASIPRFFWRVIAPFELSLSAPLVHDFLYACQGHPPEGTVVPPRTFTRLESDRLFLVLMRLEGVPLWRRWLAYCAVRLFGPRFEQEGNLSGDR